ncbi:sodium- and chloride-dependent GABA transporter 2-like [Tachypleus tridentatus]|uniref:sodium- and chloride-dependent GABA transporter 2-like n=1 Tax=Tachypleus tridentatus TaxID=6853 RepID=UPI003FD0BB35
MDETYEDTVGIIPKTTNTRTMATTRQQSRPEGDNLPASDSLSLDTDEVSISDHSLCSNRLFFLLKCLTPFAGLVNVWRYPFIVYKHGGVVLVSTGLLYVLIGLPIYHFELTIGHLHSGMGGGGQSVGKIIPLFKGMSYATAILLIMTSVYYMTVISWALCYLFTSMNESLPWSVCPDDVPSLSKYNTHFCDPENKLGQINRY